MDRFWRDTRGAVREQGKWLKKLWHIHTQWNAAVRKKQSHEIYLYMDEHGKYHGE